jgi:hypothetical protein
VGGRGWGAVTAGRVEGRVGGYHLPQRAASESSESSLSIRVIALSESSYGAGRNYLPRRAAPRRIRVISLRVIPLSESSLYPRFRANSFRGISASLLSIRVPSLVSESAFSIRVIVPRRPKSWTSIANGVDARDGGGPPWRPAPRPLFHILFLRAGPEWDGTGPARPGPADGARPAPRPCGWWSGLLSPCTSEAPRLTRLSTTWSNHVGDGSRRLSIYPSIHLSFYLYLSIYLSIYLSLSIYLYIYLIHLSSIYIYLDGSRRLGV